MSDLIPIRFDRALRPEWLDFALEQSVRRSDEAAQRQALHEYLEPQIMGKEALDKTITQLLRIVGPLSPISREYLSGCYERMCTLAPEQRTPIRLLLLTQASPFFSDCVLAIRKIGLLSTNGFAAGQLSERIVAKYGDRAIVPRAAQHVLQTLALLGALVKEDRQWIMTKVIESGSPY